MQKTSGKFESFGDHFGTLHLTKTIQKLIVFYHFSKTARSRLGTFLEDFGLHFGLLWGTFGIKKSSKKTIPKKHRKIIEKRSQNGSPGDPKIETFRRHFATLSRGPFWGSKWSQNEPKMDPKMDPKWTQKWTQKSTKNREKMIPKRNQS